MAKAKNLQGRHFISYFVDYYVRNRGSNRARH
nr:MAG TPA: hypothetical protein [Caudoviricetes sp.]